MLMGDYMKNILKGLFFAVVIVFTFMLGCMYTNLDTIYTNKNFDDNVKYFEKMEVENFVTKSSDLEDVSGLVSKLESIFIDENVVSSVDVDERKVIASSTGVFNSTEGSVDYTILRVHFKYINNSDIESDMFLYFYYSKIDYNSYSLMDVSTQDYVTIK